MKSLKMFSCAVIALAFVVHADTPAPAMDQEKMAKAWEAAGKVTENHKSLDYLVGEWNTKTTFRMGANGMAQESTGKSKFEAVFDGRFVKETFDGAAMGRPFQGIGFMGYDNTKKKYVTMWMDNMSTGMFRFEGESNDKGKTITSSSDFVCPITGKDKKVRSVFKKLGKNKVQYEHYENDLTTGKEYKAMEVTYTRG